MDVAYDAFTDIATTVLTVKCSLALFLPENCPRPILSVAYAQTWRTLYRHDVPMVQLMIDPRL